MSSEFGNRLRVSVFGQSHGKAIGVVADGLPAGEEVDMEALAQFMARRRPGRSPLSTPRQESDIPILGVVEPACRRAAAVTRTVQSGLSSACSMASSPYASSFSAIRSK